MCVSMPRTSMAASHTEVVDLEKSEQVHEVYVSRVGVVFLLFLFFFKSVK